HHPGAPEQLFNNRNDNHRPHGPQSQGRPSERCITAIRYRRRRDERIAKEEVIAVAREEKVRREPDRKYSDAYSDRRDWACRIEANHLSRNDREENRKDRDPQAVLERDRKRRLPVEHEKNKKCDKRQDMRDRGILHVASRAVSSIRVSDARQ